MTLYAATESLWRAVHQLRDEAQALRLGAVEDRPRDQLNKLVDDVGTAAETLAGWAEEIVDRAAVALGAARAADPSRLRRALDDCTGGIERLGPLLHEELAGTVRMDALTALAREAGPEPRAWVTAVKLAVDRTQLSLLAAQGALTTCWRELAEWAGNGSVAASTTTARRT